MIIKVVESRTKTRSGETTVGNGHDMGCLVVYATGLGKANEHTNPHLVACQRHIGRRVRRRGHGGLAGRGRERAGAILEGAWREAHAGREPPPRETSEVTCSTRPCRWPPTRAS